MHLESRPPLRKKRNEPFGLNGAGASPLSLDHALLRDQSAARRPVVAPLARHLSGVGASANCLHVLALVCWCVSSLERRLFSHCAVLRKLRSRPGGKLQCLHPLFQGTLMSLCGTWGLPCLLATTHHRATVRACQLASPVPSTFQEQRAVSPSPALAPWLSRARRRPPTTIPCPFLIIPNDDLGGGSHCSVEFPSSTDARLLPPPRRLEPPHCPSLILASRPPAIAFCFPRTCSYIFLQLSASPTPTAFANSFSLGAPFQSPQTRLRFHFTPPHHHTTIPLPQQEKLACANILASDFDGLPHNRLQHNRDRNAAHHGRLAARYRDRKGSHCLHGRLYSLRAYQCPIGGPISDLF